MEVRILLFELFLLRECIRELAQGHSLFLLFGKFLGFAVRASKASLKGLNLYFGLLLEQNHTWVHIFWFVFYPWKFRSWWWVSHFLLLFDKNRHFLLATIEYLQAHQNPFLGSYAKGHASGIFPLFFKVYLQNLG